MLRMSPDVGLEHIPAGLGDGGRRCIGGESEWGMVDEMVGAVALRATLRGNDARAGSKRKRGVHLRDAGSKTGKLVDDHAGLARIEIQIDNHAEGAARLQMPEHPEESSLLRDQCMSRARTQPGKKGSKKGILEPLRDHDPRLTDQRDGLAEPLEIRIVRGDINGRFPGPCVEPGDSEKASHGFPREARGPEQLDHRACETLVTPFRRATTLPRIHLSTEGRHQILLGYSTSVTVDVKCQTPQEFRKGQQQPVGQAPHKTGGALQARSLETLAKGRSGRRLGGGN